MLSLYRTMLRIRRGDPDLGDGNLRWLPSSDDVLAFERGEGFVCVTNFSPAPIELPVGCPPLLASAELTAGLLPSDATVWLHSEPYATQDRTLQFPRQGGENEDGMTARRQFPVGGWQAQPTSPTEPDSQTSKVSEE
jgi:alpha-glucosidase